MIRTPDQRLRVFVSSTLGELADERVAVRRAIERLRLSPVMFELGARPHPPRELYRAYLDQSDVFIGIYWQRYGWVAPGEEVSGLEDEYRLAGALPQLMYLKEPAPEREAGLRALLDDLQARDTTSYRRFSTPDELERLVTDDLAVLLSERFDAGAGDGGSDGSHAAPAPAPVPPTRTIGRADDVATIARLIDEGARMVTLTGPGGVGKTRLALEVARALGGRPDRPVHFVGLATVSSPALVLRTIADHLAARGATTRGPLESLVEYFRDGHAVLVLDNLEQVLSARGSLASLLERVPGLQILATSRRALRIRAEREVPIGPLGVPPLTAGTEAIERSDAVQLFADRARALGRPLAPDADSVAAVAEVCRRLDGLPLAIELVASRLRLLSPQALVERVGSVLDLPAADADVPDRQRTLRATLDWSHDLLDDPEREVFAQLSVFGGGATLEAIEAVCGPGDAVLDALAGLLDHSLVLPGEAADGGTPRFRMLEPVRAYAAERLEATGTADAVRRRHLDHVSELGRHAQPFLCGPRQREWAERFDAERANLRIAVRTGLRIGARDVVLRLAWDTFVYHYIRDAVDEPRQWLAELQEQCPEADDEVQRALLDVGLVIVGEPPVRSDPAELLVRAGEVFDRQALALEAAVSWHHLGLHRWQTGQVDAAVAALATSSQRYAAIDHDWGVATVELTLGAVSAAGGDTAAARSHHSTALAHARRIDNRPQMAQALQGLALVAARDGRVDEAVATLREGVAIVVADRSVTGATYCLEALAAAAVATGDVELAARCLGAARSARERLAVPEWMAAADAAEPVVTAVRAALPSERADVLATGDAQPDLFTLLQDGLAALDPAGAAAGDR